jgi:hypothetical protein
VSELLLPLETVKVFQVSKAAGIIIQVENGANVIVITVTIAGSVIGEENPRAETSFQFPVGESLSVA